MDAFSFTNWKRLGACILTGMISCTVVFAITRIFTWEQMWIGPILEETLKAIFIVHLINNKREATLSVNNKIKAGFSIAFFAEAIVYGMAVGAGFSVVENTLYVFYNVKISLLECSIRGLGTALIHMGCTAFVATCLLTFSRIKKTPRFISITIALLCAFSIHLLYNLFLIPAFAQMLLTIFVFIILFMLLYQKETCLIHDWLDICITNDIELLGNIHKGNLENTNAGKYLVALKSSFNEEVFFDMIVFLQLYLELSIKAKSRLILRDAEMDVAIPPKEHEEDMQRLKELSVLQNNIGIAGLSALSPLIKEKDTDKWVINKLL